MQAVQKKRWENVACPSVKAGGFLQISILQAQERCRISGQYCRPMMLASTPSFAETRFEPGSCNRQIARAARHHLRTAQMAQLYRDLRL
ncbi:hypothetical protein ACVDG5_035280 [Mesorhizobium sp. ORM6]